MGKGIVRVMSIFLLQAVGAIPRVSSKLACCEEDGHVPWTVDERGEGREIARAVAIVPGVQQQAHASFDKILYRPREALNRENCIQWPTSRKEVIGLARPERPVSTLSVVERRDVIVARITTFVQRNSTQWLSCRDNVQPSLEEILFFPLFSISSYFVRDNIYLYMEKRKFVIKLSILINFICGGGEFWES